MNLLTIADGLRQATLESLSPVNQTKMGQYFTPILAAQILGSLPKLPRSGCLRVLDPGAGSGVLTAAIIERIHIEAPGLKVSVTAVESDPALCSALTKMLSECQGLGITTTLIRANFVDWALTTKNRFDLVIQNPPYYKLRSGSPTDRQLKASGVFVPNMYAAFMSLGILLLANRGQQVSITPRSWMNGSYYSNFRRSLLERFSIDVIHTFESRSKVFGDMGILQESVVVCGTVGGPRETVKLRSSLDQSEEPSERIVPYGQVVTDDFVFLPASDRDAQAVFWMERATCTLADLGLQVSTCRVVDFRHRDLLRSDPNSGSRPMIYPMNIKQGTVCIL